MAAKKTKKYFKIFLYPFSAAVFFALLLFLALQASWVPANSIFVSSENLKQGDAVLVKVSRNYSSVSGSFNNEKIIFYQNGKYADWFALLGIDVGVEPGKYKISVVADGQPMEKEINISANNFLSANAVLTQTAINNIKNNDNPVLKKALENSADTPYFYSSFSAPLASLQKSGFDFGEFIKTGNSRIQHMGVDLRAGEGTKVFAVNNGKVVLAENLSNYGKTIIIDHGLGIFSMYLHLEDFKVSLEDIVKKNQVIGLSGNTGYSTAPHLHFSMRDNGARIDPVAFIKETKDVPENPNLASILDLVFRLKNW